MTAATSHAPALPAREAHAQSHEHVDTTHAPLVAVCGLTGGAGTSTVAYLLALRAARETHVGEPVLLCEVQAAGGGLSDLIGMSSTHTLAELGSHALAGTTPGGELLIDLAGLRVIAPPPRPLQAHAASENGAGVRRALGDALEAHAVTVVDCATLRSADAQPVLQAASHVVWVAPGRGPAAARAASLLRSPLAPAPGQTPELLLAVGRHNVQRLAPDLAPLREIARTRCRRLVLMPHSPTLAAGDPDLTDERAKRALTAIDHFLAS